MRERDIERKLVSEIKKRGGGCLKLVSPGNSGVPDRLCLFPGGKAIFVEIKAPGKVPRPLQEAQIRKLRNLGFPVFVVNDEKEITELLEVPDA